MNGLVVVSCGSAKRAEPAPAAQLYTGNYFRLGYAAAVAMQPDHGVLIISARHGLIRPDTIVAPYEQRMGQPGCITPAALLAQAEALGVVRARPVFLFVGAAYAKVLLLIWPHAHRPLARTHPLGRAYQQFNAIAATADPWARP